MKVGNHRQREQSSNGQDGDRGLSRAPQTGIRALAGILEEGDGTVPTSAKRSGKWRLTN
jgi:hypothetical protein